MKQKLKHYKIQMEKRGEGRSTHEAPIQVGYTIEKALHILVLGASRYVLVEVRLLKKFSGPLTSKENEMGKKIKYIYIV